MQILPINTSNSTNTNFKCQIKFNPDHSFKIEKHMSLLYENLSKEQLVIVHSLFDSIKQIMQGYVLKINATPFHNNECMLFDIMLFDKNDNVVKFNNNVVNQIETKKDNLINMISGILFFIHKVNNSVPQKADMFSHSVFI